ncbi:5-formyltetrahydrofolate cyclo-ligase [Sphingomonas sp. G124]|uniref:5-formyltetrahydrofolate cyclo-ligase n=1 Tax=Sphingomonas cremea TaxID=2904799 RepID=A0A9X1QIV4_9SPHN|nr:5-formyltetrahydrofolate cyclo-ligase [Sphingomonas cremea]MCF2513920.1 5-formyltetrahydrofolate cyclo-ligase [Sphingomonas cremea]
MVVPSLSPASADKVALRRQARERRRAFIEQLDPQDRDKLEVALAGQLAPLISRSRIIGGYCHLPSEVSPLPAMQLAADGGATLAFPAFADHQSVFRFLAGDPVEPGPWACFQPPLTSPEVFPDLVLVPLVAIDGKGTRLGQGKGHYDRVLARLRERGALLIGVGWQVQKLKEQIPADPWDVPLDGFASPDGVEMFR